MQIFKQMKAHSKQTSTLSQLGFLSILIIFSVITNQFLDIDHGIFFYLLQISKTILFLIIARLSYKLILHLITQHYKKFYKKKHPPHLIVRIIQFLVSFSFVLCIIVFVFDKPVYSLMAFGGIIGAGIALGIGPIILDAFSGLVHEVESGFEIDDWIQIDGQLLGKVKKIFWRTIVLETSERTTIVIPQRKLSDGFINLSKPNASLIQTVEITLDHTIPIDRGERLLTAAVSLVDGVYQKNCSALAFKATEGGIVYTIRYLINGYDHWREIRHRVLEAITNNLHEHGLKLSETIGEYALSKGGSPFQEYRPLTANQVLSKVDIFSVLTKEEFSSLCKSAEKILYNKGDIIVEQYDKGESLFVIAEGIVEVSMKQMPKSQSVSIAHLQPYAFFGEMSLLSGQKRSATVRAETNCCVYALSKDSLAPIFEQNPKLVELIAYKIEERKKNKEAKKIFTSHKKTEPLSEATKLISTIKKYFDI